MNDRTDIINHLIEKYGYQTYLEIGVEHGVNFNKVIAPHKWGVDPHSIPGSGVTHRITSNEFFKQNTATFDIIFIDGLHYATQAYDDALNSLKVLNEGGSIVMHDCSPYNEDMQRQPFPGPNTEWTGDVWKAWCWLRTRAGLKMAVMDVDYGVGIIQRGNNASIILPDVLTYEYLEKHRQELLNLLPPEELDNFLIDGRD
jgi:hypothetical protein